MDGLVFHLSWRQFVSQFDADSARIANLPAIYLLEMIQRKVLCNCSNTLIELDGAQSMTSGTMEFESNAMMTASAAFR